MALTIKLFPGGNTGQGFYSCFSGVMDGKERLLLLKGGPGVGKSSMMKRFARALDAEAEPILGSTAERTEGRRVRALAPRCVD